MKVYRGIGYSRVSIKNQVYDRDGKRIEDGSLDSQKRRILEYLKMKSYDGGKYELIGFHEDAGVSAKNTDREAYQRMWKFIESRKVDFIVATELSRLSRSTSDFISLMEHCSKHAVDIYLLREGFQTNTIQGKMMAMICAMLSELERETTVARIKANVQSRLRSKGRINGACEILGLDRCKVQKEQYVINEKEVETLVKILNLYLRSEGKADCLREMKTLKLFDKKGKLFTKDRFDRLLNNVDWRLRGYWFEKDSKTGEVLEEIELSHGQVIPTDLIEKVSKKLKLEQSKKKGCGTSGNTYLLSGILFDKKGSSYIGSRGNGSGGAYFYYYNKEKKHRVNADDLESRVDSYMLETIDNSHYLKKLLDKNYVKRSSKIDEGRLKLVELEKTIKELNVEVKDQKNKLKSASLSATSINIISELIQELGEKKNSLQAEHYELGKDIEKFKESNVTSELKGKLNKIKKVYMNASRKEKKKLIRQFFDRIIILNDYEIQVMLKASNTEAFLMDEVVIKERQKVDDQDYIRGLYVKKQMSLRKIASKLGCCRDTVKRRLLDIGVKVNYTSKSYKKLSQRANVLVERGDSFQVIANKFNIWRVPTRSGEGMWHPKTIRDLILLGEKS